MRNYWKEHRNRGLENCISKSVEDDTRYCHAFKAIPKVEIGMVVTSGPLQQAETRLFDAAKIPFNPHAAFNMNQSIANQH
jgi:hypothetical protein